MPEPERNPSLRLGGQRAQHGGDLAGGAARPGRLDRERVLEVGDQLGIVGVAVLLALGGGGVDDRGEGGRDLGTPGLNVGKLFADVLHRHRHLVLALERDLPGQHLVEDDPEGIEVRLPGDGLPERLLGRDVVGRPQHPAIRGEALLLERAGDPEVSDLGRALLVDQDVLRLDVAVDDVAGVCGAQGPRDFDRVGDRLGHRQPSLAADPLLERLALHVLEHDVRTALVLAGVDHPDDVGVRELGDRPRLAAKSLELIGVARHLAVHQLDCHRPLEGLVACPVHGRHSPGTDPGFQPIAAAERRSEQGAHVLVSILRYMPVDVAYYTDPCCPWSWALEPALRKLEWEFGENLCMTHVMCGMAQQFGDPAPLIEQILAAAASSGMPVDARLWLERPLRSSHPACIGVKAASEQGDPGPYVRRLREGILCRRAKLDGAEALIAQAALTDGLDLERFRVDLSSHAVLEAFGADLERAQAVPAEHRAQGSDRVKLPSLEFSGSDGGVHGVYGPSAYDELRAAATAAGAQPTRAESPGVEQALGYFGAMSTAEVAAVCALPGPRAPAELWRLATEWRLTPERLGSGELWTLS